MMMGTDSAYLFDLARDAPLIVYHLNCPVLGSDYQCLTVEGTVSFTEPKGSYPITAMTYILYISKYNLLFIRIKVLILRKYISRIECMLIGSVLHINAISLWEIPRSVCLMYGKNDFQCHT